MRPSHLLFLFTLFHHHHKPQPPAVNEAVLTFAAKEEMALQTYEVGDVRTWLESDYIVNIEQDIDYLRRNSTADDALEMENKITDEMLALQDLDVQIQKDMWETKPITKKS